MKPVWGAVKGATAPWSVFYLVGERSKSEGLPACRSGEAIGEEEADGIPSSSDFSSWLYAPLPSANSLHSSCMSANSSDGTLQQLSLRSIVLCSVPQRDLQLSKQQDETLKHQLTVCGTALCRLLDQSGTSADIVIHCK